MHLTFNNINDAFRGLVTLFRDNRNGIVQSRRSRNGPVLVIDEPVTVTYLCPTRRVLFNAARDANPFLHLYESLWMLAGRNDVAPLAYYAKRFEQYSDDGRTLNGAYGYRWRHAAGKSVEHESGIGPTYEWNTTDQLDIIVAHLKADPTSRRAVLQMWNVEDDLLKVGPAVVHTLDHHGEPTDEGELRPYSKDVCCNLSVMFSLVDGCRDTNGEDVSAACKFLDMTVTNRSNDLVWGMLGANYVHFTFLQEYLAARLGAEVGRYHQFTNNLHVYTESNSGFKPDEWLAEYKTMDYTDYRDPFPPGNVGLAYAGPPWRTVPLVRDPEAFERELPRFVEENGKDPKQGAGGWTEPFLAEVVQPALHAYHLHKRGSTFNDHHKFTFCERIKADDWRLACTQWLQRRQK